ncbi:MAG: hypothetical protein AAF581_03145 [Planctomycetota bacterium]
MPDYEDDKQGLVRELFRAARNISMLRKSDNDDFTAEDEAEWNAGLDALSRAVLAYGSKTPENLALSESFGVWWSDDDEREITVENFCVAEVMNCAESSTIPENISTELPGVTQRQWQDATRFATLVLSSLQNCGPWLQQARDFIEAARRVSALPRDFDEVEREACLAALRNAVLVVGSETECNLALCESLTTSVAENGRHEVAVGGYSVVDIVACAQSSSIPDYVADYLPGIPQCAWENGMRFATLVLTALRE